MPDIFISYARSTAREAQAMGEALRALGYGVWRDDDLPSHRSYSDVIEEQLELAKAVVVVWSADAVRSQWVRSEADKARSHDKLVQLTVDTVRLPMPFDQIQCADLTGWSGETDHPGWMKILASIAELAGHGAAPTAAERSPETGLMAVLAAEIEGVGLLRLNHRAALEEASRTSAQAFRTDVEARGGSVFREGDGAMMAGFASPAAAIDAAIQAQLAVSARTWPGLGALKVRMAVHFGAVEPRGRDYMGPALNRIGKLLALAQGDQILVTGAVAELAPDGGGYSFKSVGAHALEDPLTKVNLLQVMAPGLQTDFTPIAAAEDAPLPGNLPRRPGALIGREAELEQIGSLFETSDLVTVTGTGGVGKTRIAIEYAHLQQGRHEDGVWLVELAPIADPEQVTAVIARTLGLVLPPGDPVRALADRLRPRDCLIVLDNCEHVIDAVALVAEATLEHAPGVKLLASSQELIGVEGERVFRLRSLDEADAASLFSERARAVEAGFTASGRDAAAIAAICQRLDGIPLAIEMAAARAPSLGCEGVLQRLDDRFRILTGGRRTALPRQRTLAATLDWSHGLLSPADAAVFRRLGVFTGGFTLDAASRIAGDAALDAMLVIDALSSLVAKSLVVAETEDNRTRYRLLETTRMYALERMAEAGETLAVQRRHAEHFATVCESCVPDYFSLPDDAFHARYAADMDNVERAMDWAFGPGGDDELGLALTGRSWSIWAALSKWAAYLTWSDLALPRITAETPEPTALRVRATAATINAITRAAPGVGEQFLPALRAQADWTLIGDVLMNMTFAYILQGRHEKAVAAHAELAAIVAPLPANRLKVGFQRLAGTLAADAGDFAGAVTAFEIGLEMAKAIGAFGWANLIQGERLYFADGTPPDAAIADARDLLARIRPDHMFSSVSSMLGTYQLMRQLALRNGPGDLEEAFALGRAREKEEGRVVPIQTQMITPLLALADGRPRDGARLFGYATATMETYGVRYAEQRKQAEAIRLKLSGSLSDADVVTLMAEGARLTPEQHFILSTKLEG